MIRYPKAVAGPSKLARLRGAYAYGENRQGWQPRHLEWKATRSVYERGIANHQARR